MAREWTVGPSERNNHTDMRIALVAIDSVEKVGFAESMLGAINTCATFEHCTVFRFTKDTSDRIGCSILDAASRHHTRVARHTSELFIERFAQFDWNTRYLGLKASDVVQASYFSTRDLVHHEYRSCCYERNGLVDRLSFAITDGCDSVVTFNLYRSLRQGNISSHECAALIGSAPVIARAALRHASRARPESVERGIDLMRRLPDGHTLTRREHQLCALLLDGLTLRTAAEQMEIQLSTATTLKRRAFARLHLQTKDDLLRRVIG
jgi:DNA-binding CsgD family transcriptional regulator